MPTTHATISIIIPALNEEAYIGTTLEHVTAAAASLQRHDRPAPEIIVVDNGSTDRTAGIAKANGARVIDAPKGNVAIARNVGARAAGGDVLVFVDADTLWPESLLVRIDEVMSDEQCLGGAVDTHYQPKRFLVRAYLRFWRVAGRLFRMAQGATQFCRASAFESLKGYDETMFMGEDVDFYWRLRETARKNNARVELIDDVKVVPSCRRFDQWPLWKTLVLTNPLICGLFMRKKRPWRDWYDRPIR